MADDREPLGRIVREVWVTWALEQPDVAGHPSWIKPWDELDQRDREVDMRIGSAVAARALAGYEAERAELTRERMSRSVKLARIRALCRRRADLGDPAEAAVAGEILAVIGSEEEADHG